MTQHEIEARGVGRDHPRGGPFPRDGRPGRIATGAAFTKWAQIIGVTESDTTVEMRWRRSSVTENSLNNRPTTPPMNRSGDERRDQRQTDRDHVNPI